MGLFYCTREQVKRAAQISGPDQDPTIDRLLESASREIEDSYDRLFYPLVATRYYDLRGRDVTSAWLLWYNNDLMRDYDWASDDSSVFPLEWLTRDQASFKLRLYRDLLAIDTLTCGGVAITTYFLEPANDGPPYNRVELDLAQTPRFERGDTGQRVIVILGTWGYCNVQKAAGALAEDDDGTETALDITDSSLIGVGDLILVGAERMIVTEKDLLSTTTAINMAGNVAADEAIVALTVDDGSKIHRGEIITIDAERMLVENVAGTVVGVKRAYDGSVLAAHLNDAVVYAPRTLTVERAAAGTVAHSHTTAAAITKNVPPGLIAELCLAETLYAYAQEQGHFALTAGQGEAIREISGKGIADVRSRADYTYGPGMPRPRST